MGLLSDLWQLALAAGLGSIITQYVTRSRERRELRAGVRTEISAVEELRWVPDGAAAADKARDNELVAARRRLLAAAMIARLPRGITSEYDNLALAAYNACKSRAEATDEGSLPPEVSVCVDEAFRLMCDLLWRPYWTRLVVYRRRLANLKRLVEKNAETSNGRWMRYRYPEP